MTEQRVKLEERRRSHRDMFLIQDAKRAHLQRMRSGIMHSQQESKRPGGRVGAGWRKAQTILKLVSWRNLSDVVSGRFNSCKEITSQRSHSQRRSLYSGEHGSRQRHHRGSVRASTVHRVVPEDGEELELQEVNHKEETAEEASVRVAAAMAQMKQAQEAERARAEEEERQRRLAPVRILESEVAFGPLKRMLLERGVAKEQLDSCNNKHGLIKLAREWPHELHIEWIDQVEAI